MNAMKPALDLPMTASPASQPDAEAGGNSRILALVKAALALGLAVLLPVALDDYYLYLASQVAIYAIATLGLDIVFGRTGQLSLSHASFFGLGAYASALMADWGWSIWLQVPVIVLLAILAGAVVAVPTLRLSGLRLSLVTLLFGELFIWAINHSSDMTGGSQGMAVPPLEIGNFSSVTPLHGYILAVAISAIATLLVIQISRSQIGRRMLAVRDSELAATSVGIHIVKTKITAFIMSAIFAGIAGCLYAYTSGFVSPTTFDLFGSVNFLVAVILGGAGRSIGAWLGAAYIVLVPEAFTAFGYTNLFPLLGGFVLIVVTLLLPGGLTEGFTRAVGFLRSERRRNVS
jgi:branched-chain amino acid transport system permease protein